MRHIHIIVTLLISLTFIIGCGKNVSLSGKVTFTDGSPLTTGTVIFDDGQSIARGTIREDGSYSVGFEREGNGLPKGEYRVYVQATETKVVSTRKDELYGSEIEETAQVPLVAEKWTKPETSGLTCSVGGKTKFDITVEKPE